LSSPPLDGSTSSSPLLDDFVLMVLTSITYHPKIDGQTKVVNYCLEDLSTLFSNKSAKIMGVMAVVG